MLTHYINCDGKISVDFGRWECALVLAPLTEACIVTKVPLSALLIDIGDPSRTRVTSCRGAAVYVY